MLICRVAEHCFWFGRYLERAEATARSLGSTRDALMGADLEERSTWLPVIIASGEEERFTEHFIGADPRAAEDGERVQHYMVWDERNPSSLRASIAAVRANARSIRDHLSLEVWQQINELHWWIAHDPQTPGPLPRAPSAASSSQGLGSARSTWEHDRHDFYAHVIESAAMTAGLLGATMLRGGPFDFIGLGTMIERASQTARILDVQHHALQLWQPHVVIDTVLWLALLRACTGYEPFMRRHRGRVSGPAVATFLIQDPCFPRSIGFALQAALERLASIRQENAIAGSDGGSSHERLAVLTSWLASRPAEDLAGGAIHEVLTRVVDEAHEIADQIGIEFLGHSAQ